jgi:hypothetical protein
MFQLDRLDVEEASLLRFVSVIAPLLRPHRDHTGTRFGDPHG